MVPVLSDVVNSFIDCCLYRIVAFLTFIFCISSCITFSEASSFDFNSSSLPITYLVPIIIEHSIKIKFHLLKPTLRQIKPCPQMSNWTTSLLGNPDTCCWEILFPISLKGQKCNKQFTCGFYDSVKKVIEIIKNIVLFFENRFQISALQLKQHCQVFPLVLTLMKTCSQLEINTHFFAVLCWSMTKVFNSTETVCEKLIEIFA